MGNAGRHSRFNWGLAALVALVIGVQVLQSAHLHADHGPAIDCVQCQVDGGQAMAVSESVTPPCLPALTATLPVLAEHPLSTYSQLSARGPPHLSS